MISRAEMRRVCAEAIAGGLGEEELERLAARVEAVRAGARQVAELDLEAEECRVGLE